jgi:hypothetical protein
MDFFAVHTKINKKKASFFFVMLGPWYGAHSMTSVWTRLNVFRDGLDDMLCVVWVGRTLRICHRMSIDVLFCALTLL